MSRRGFTLIEILVASTLFALLMGAYYAAFSNVLLLDEYARDQRAFGSVGPKILDLVEDDMLSLYTHPREPATSPFRGQNDTLSSEPADRLQFVTRRASIHQEEFFGRDRWTRSPINETGYRLARGDARRGDVRVLYRREGYHVDESPLQGGDFYEIYDRVIAFDVTYAGFQEEEAERATGGTLVGANLDKFESWDSEERRGYPTALIVRLVIEAPRMVYEGYDDRGDREKPEQRVFTRIIPLVQADDVKVPEGGADPGAGDGGLDPSGAGGAGGGGGGGGGG